MAWPEPFAVFLERTVPKFIHLAAYNHGAAPFGCRGYAFRAEAHAASVYVVRSQWARLENYMDKRPSRIAVLVTSGVDNESYQVKGRFAGCRPLEQEDTFVLDKAQAVIRETFPHMSAPFMIQPWDCMAIGIEPSAVYIQTPGPMAGELLGRSVPS